MIARFNAVMVNNKQDLCTKVNMRIVDSIPDNPLYVYLSIQSEQEALEIQQQMQSILHVECNQKIDYILGLKSQIKQLEIEAKNSLIELKMQYPLLLKSKYPELLI